MGALGFAAACAVVALSATRIHGGGAGGYVASKGSPAVQVLVHHDGATRIWDQHTAIEAGDALALRVACEGFDVVTVAAPSNGRWQRVSSGTCTPNEPLPFTLVVDRRPGDEQLAVVLGHASLDDEELASAVAANARTESLWTVNFVLPKTVGSTR